MEAKKIIITGGATRVGAAIAKSLAGFEVFITVHYNKSKKLADKLKKELENLGSNVFLIKADLNNSFQVQRLIKNAFNKMRGLDCLINNASVFEYDDISNFEKNKWDLHMSVNGKSQLILINSLMNQLSENNEGSIVNISDQKIASPNPDYLSYTASRFAMMGMTNALALGLAPRARINSVAPGHTLASPDQTDSGLIKAQKQSPLGRGPTPDEIAESVTFLMNNKSITGQTIFVDCGERLLSRKRDIVFETEE